MDTGRVVDRTLNLYVRPAIFAQSLFCPSLTLAALLRLKLRYPILKRQRNGHCLSRATSGSSWRLDSARCAGHGFALQ